MRLLYFAPHQLWPLTTGGRLRDFHLARELAKRCSVTFLEIRHPGDAESRPAPDIGGFTGLVSVEKERSYTPAKMLWGMLGPTPVTVLNFRSGRIRAALEELVSCGNFDGVQLEGVHLGEYVSAFRSAAKRPWVVADWHNIESELMRRYADETSSTIKALVARRTSVLLQRAERKLLACAEAHTVTSERERHAIGIRHPGAVIHTIPNGVDAGLYSPNETASAARDAGFPPAGRRWLLFVGSMDYHANVNALRWFAHEAWPGIAAHHNDLDLVVVGRDPTPEVRALASKRIRITGTVEDVRPYYGAALAMIVPLRVGGGTRLKILESMAAKVPVISTRLGIEGIDAEIDSHYLLADTPEEMSRAVDRLFASPETGQRIAGAAAKLIAARYDWQTIGKALYEVHFEFYERRG